VLAAAGVFSKESAPTSSIVAHTGPASGRQHGQGQHPQTGKHHAVLTPPAGASPCPETSDLWVNRHTSCPFAGNTRSAYAESGGADNIQVYSPVTGVTYAMACSGTSLVLCSGGNEAKVWFSRAKASGQDTTPVAPPEPEPEPTAEPTYSGEATQSCDQNISANQVTSCPFAEEVFVAYWEEYESYGEETYSYVNAYSPTTSKSYGMDCYLEDDFVECTGGNEALVTFPMQAVREY
jgi:hypothetical protein